MGGAGATDAVAIAANAGGAYQSAPPYLSLFFFFVMLGMEYGVYLVHTSKHCDTELHPSHKPEFLNLI